MINSKLVFTLIVILLTPLGTANSSEKLKLPPTVVGKDFGFTEGPVWVSHKEMWLFTDIPKNKIYSLTANGALDVWMEKSEYANGLNIDKENNVWMREIVAKFLTQHLVEKIKLWRPHIMTKSSIARMI